MLELDETEALPEGAAAPEATPATPEAAPAQVAPQPAVVPFGGDNFDANHYKMDYRGQQVIPTDAAHLKALAQKGYSYSQSMEELGKKTREFEQTQTDHNTKFGHYEAFDNKMKADPVLYDQVMQLMNGQTPQNGNGGITRNSHTDGEINEIKAQLSAMKDAEEDRFLANSMKELKSQYSNYDWETDSGDGKLDQRLMQHAINKGLDHTQMDLVFQNYFFDQIQNEARVNAAAQVSDKVQAQNKAGIPQGANAIAPPQGAAPPDYKGMSHAQISAHVNKTMGNI